MCFMHFAHLSFHCNLKVSITLSIFFNWRNLFILFIIPRLVWEPKEKWRAISCIHWKKNHKFVNRERWSWKFIHDFIIILTIPAQKKNFHGRCHTCKYARGGVVGKSKIWRKLSDEEVFSLSSEPTGGLNGESSSLLSKSEMLPLWAILWSEIAFLSLASNAAQTVRDPERSLLQVSARYSSHVTR